MTSSDDSLREAADVGREGSLTTLSFMTPFRVLCMVLAMESAAALPLPDGCIFPCKYQYFPKKKSTVEITFLVDLSNEKNLGIYSQFDLAEAQG
jgi:hypothetical protein